MFTLFFLFCSLALANPNLFDPNYWQEKGKHHSSSSSSSSITSGSYDSLFNKAIYNLLPDVGFYSFTFGRGNAGQYAFQSFYANVQYPTVLSITDCFCSGDMFVLEVDSTRYLINDCKPVPNDSCKKYCTNPEVCLFDKTRSWCHNQAPIPLSPGFHNITIKAAVTVLEAGTGFIILQRAASDDLGVAACSIPWDPLYPCNYGVFQ